jgi:signal transduction histidine kinase
LVHSRNSLVVALIVTTLVVTAALGLAGWRLVNQQRDADARRAQERADAIAKSVGAAIRGKLAEAGDRLSAAAASADGQLPAIAGAAVMTARSDGAVINASGLPFVPAVPDTSAIDVLFEEAEALEIARADLAAAASRYQAMATDANPAIRAAALLRLGRVAAKRGDRTNAARVYQQLERSGNVRVGQLPAQFVALYQQRALAREDHDAERERSLTALLTDGLDTGEWLLIRGAADTYREWLGMRDYPATWRLAEAVEQVWQIDGPALPRRGQRTIRNDRSVLVMWRGSGTVTAAMAAFLDEFLPPTPSETEWHLSNPGGLWIGGNRFPPSRAAAPIVVGDPDSPWLLSVGLVGGDSARSQWTLVAMMTAMVAFLWGGVYLMARGLRREAAVARLQSDFVAAVSHEFRSPLTTIRQMAEMLELGRVTSENRRQEYYSVLSSEASRLQRLVETLLNFGKMEAGAARYRSEHLDLSAVVRRVVQEMEPSASESGKRILTNGPEESVIVRADPSALGLALRNVVDNAIKYSPNDSDIRIEWDHDDGRAIVRVVDRGIGIPRVEHETIFEKFVRGRSAVDSNVAGTGVGLAMVRQILRAHDGDVHVESEVGRGSTFTLVLPLANSQPAFAKAAAGLADAPAARRRPDPRVVTPR